MNDVIDSPHYLAYKFNFETEDVEFLPVEPGRMRTAASLQKEALQADGDPLRVPLSEVAGVLDSPDEPLRRNPPRFIFHTAFCASTFLARCFDVEGVCTGLREPQLLLDAANAKRMQWRSKTTRLDFRQLPRLALKLLHKHAGESEKLLIKPINSVNNIIPELLELTDRPRALMMYTDARNFLLSTLRKGEGGRQMVRIMFDLIRCDFPHLANLRLTDVVRMTDLKTTLSFWRLQTEQAEAALKRFAPGNAMASLYAETLINDTGAALRAANRFLDLGIADEQIEAILDSEVRSRDAKHSGESFSVQKRDEAYRALESFYGGELDKGYQWITGNNPKTRLQPTLTAPLSL